MDAWFIASCRNLERVGQSVLLNGRRQKLRLPRSAGVLAVECNPVNRKETWDSSAIFFQLVSARYERGSIILTSNKSYGDWGSIFGDPIIATAILDRLLHQSTTIHIRGESYRLDDRRKAGLFPRAEEETRPAPFPSSHTLQNGPRRQGSAAPRKTGAPLTAPGRSGDGS